MFANDDIPLETRHRLFNVFVSSDLKDHVITHEKELSTKIFAYVMDLQEDVTKEAIIDYPDVIKFVESFECQHLLSDSVIKILKDTNPEKVKVCLFMFGPRGTPCLSAFAFDKQDVLKNYPFLLGECPKKYVENPWFSKKILSANFDVVKVIPGVLKSLEKTKPNELCLIVMKNQQVSVKFAPIDQLKKVYETYLIANDQYEHLKKSLGENTNTLLFVMENYYIWYPLVVQYKKDKDQYTWKIF